MICFSDLFGINFNAKRFLNSSMNITIYNNRCIDLIAPWNTGNLNSQSETNSKFSEKIILMIKIKFGYFTYLKNKSDKYLFVIYTAFIAIQTRGHGYELAYIHAQMFGSSVYWSTNITVGDFNTFTTD